MKPNADSIARSKKLWERLRRKSHVPRAERRELVAELFGLITGNVRDFVFKHDAVRVIQCALKYANQEQRRQIARELKGNYRDLAESRYGKFLIAKIVVGDDEIRDMVVPEFYGHVKRLMKHSEASWIVDDIYRTLATKSQKARLLREWYGPEFVIFGKGAAGELADQHTAELTVILQQHPEKKGPIMQHLKETTNQMVQKKTTGFTMLHDAMLQYFLNTKPSSPEATEFLDMLRDDEGGDCLKNLAFTESGSRLVCLALAYGNSKDRRTLLKVFKTHIKLLAADVWGHKVLLAAYEVIDDTVMVSKAIFPELLDKDLSAEQRREELLGLVEHQYARIPLLYVLAPEPPKWLIKDDDAKLMMELRDIRRETSKKEPETRRTELAKAMSQPLLDLIASRAAILIQSTFGCQFISEVLFGGIGEKAAALNAIAELPKSDDIDLNTPAAGRLFKALVQGGPFDRHSKQVSFVMPPLDFHDLLFNVLGVDFSNVVSKWAFGENSFIVLAMLEANNFAHKDDVVKILSIEAHKHKGSLPTSQANAGTKLVLAKLAADGAISISDFQ